MADLWGTGVAHQEGWEPRWNAKFYGMLAERSRKAHDSPVTRIGEQEPGLRTLGVLGGIGSGKSTVARFLVVELPKGLLLDADALVSELLDEPETAQRVHAGLGGDLLLPDGSLDRAALGRRIFESEADRRVLEGLLHPPVRECIRTRLKEAEAQAQPTWAVLDVPLLLEGGLDRVCDFLLFVDTPEEQRSTRACARHGWSRQDWRAREATQAPLEEKRAAADAILDNAGGEDPLRSAVQSLLPRLLSLPPRPLLDRWPPPDSRPEA